MESKSRSLPGDIGDLNTKMMEVIAVHEFIHGCGLVRCRKFKASGRNDPRRTRRPELTAIVHIFDPLSVITCVTFDFFGSIFQ
jgi:hypothetical protein